jgi:DNA-directed RNA polymerase I, II, and III subunit RPABC2
MQHIIINNDASTSSSSDTSQSHHRTTKYLTTFEEIKVLGARAMQLRNNAEPLVEVIGNGRDTPMDVAKRELHAKRLKFIVRRFLPDGTFEDRRVDQLEICKK